MPAERAIVFFTANWGTRYCIHARTGHASERTCWSNFLQQLQEVSERGHIVALPPEQARIRTANPDGLQLGRRSKNVENTLRQYRDASSGRDTSHHRGVRAH